MALTPNTRRSDLPGETAQSLPGGFLQLAPAPTRRLQTDSSHRFLRSLPARGSQPRRPRAPARKREAGEVQSEEDIRAAVGARAHLHPQARSSGHKTDRHWGRTPSASRPTWAPLPRSASRPPRPAHCAGVCGLEGLDHSEGGSAGDSQSQARSRPFGCRVLRVEARGSATLGSRQQGKEGRHCVS